ANPSEVLTVLAGTITLSAPPPANGSPIITITSAAFPVQNFSSIALIILTKNGANIIYGTESAGSASIPTFSNYVWPGVQTTLEIDVLA
ncbi:MAG TPA: hypothetical protein VMD07_08645, partial [Candidatus Acidoferrales bacterium]|nr:hypothetical protein [Candidatus Acidoferrales bacterium]